MEGKWGFLEVDAQVHRRPRLFFQELASQDVSGYMDMGKVAFPYLRKAFPTSILGSGGDRRMVLQQGLSFTCFVLGLSQKTLGDGAPALGGEQLR